MLWISENHIVMRLEIEGASSAFEIAFEDQAGCPLHIASYLHDHLLEDSSIFGATPTRHAVAIMLGFRILSSLVAIVRYRQYIFTTADGHELLRIVISMYSPLHIVSPAHNKASTISNHDVWISRSFQAQLHITVAFPTDNRAGMEAHSNLVPEADSLRSINLWLRKNLQ